LTYAVRNPSEVKSGQPGWEQRRLGLTGMLTAFYEQQVPKRVTEKHLRVSA